MANEYKNLPVLSKVKIGNDIYYVKDAEVRALLDTYSNAVEYNVSTTFEADKDDIATSKAIASYLEGKISGLTGAMHFVGVTEALPETGGAGDIVIVEAKDDEGKIITTTEYVHDGAQWILIGDEGVYATKSNVERDFVKKTFTIAGIGMADNIAVADLQAALKLKALAYHESASATLTDYATGITGAAYKPEGSVEVVLKDAAATMSAEGSFTPIGTVTGNVTAAGAVTLARDNENGFQVTGTVSAPTVTVTPETDQIQHIDSVGALPTYTAAQYTAPSVTEAKAEFASEGIVAAIDATDNECLVFTAAGKANALTSTGFKAGSYVAAEFNAGALPTFGAAKTVVTGIASAEASAPNFTGDKIGATFAGSQVAIAADFAGQQGNVAVSGSYNKPFVESAAFTGTEATITPTLATGNKIVTVTVQ